MSEVAYTVRPFTPGRRFFVDAMDFGERRHCMQGLIEVDVTAPRRLLGELKARGAEAPSFTGFVVYCCARAVSLDRSVQAYRDWRGQLILFDDVDVFVPVERTQGEHFTHTIIRAADRKSLREIHMEIRQAQFGPAPRGDSGSFFRWYGRLPRIARRAFFAVIYGRPTVLKGYAGTVMVTSVGMFGSGAGWGFAPVGHALSVTIGGIVARPCAEGGQLVEHEHLCLTVTLDHEVVDGAPAARFIVKLKELLETGYGLTDW